MNSQLHNFKVDALILTDMHFLIQWITVLVSCDSVLYCVNMCAYFQLLLNLIHFNYLPPTLQFSMLLMMQVRMS